jgi:hypothetical protein
VQKLSHRRATTFSVIGLEGLNVKGIGRNSHLFRSVAYAGIGIIRAQMENQSTMTGAFFIPTHGSHPAQRSILAVVSLTVCRLQMTRCHPTGGDDRVHMNASIILKIAASDAWAA